MTNPPASAADPAEPRSGTATVVAFPSRGPAPDHLARALATLHDALMQQQAAIKTWRGAMQDLRHSAATLQGSLQRYRSNLHTLADDVAVLRRTVLALEQSVEIAGTD